MTLPRTMETTSGGTDASGQPQSWTGRIDITQQRRDARTLYVCGAIAGVAGSVAVAMALLAIDEQQFAKYGFGAGFSIGIIMMMIICIRGSFGDLMAHIHGSECLIKVREGDLRELRHQLNRRVQAAGDGVRAPAATVHQLNGRKPRSIQ